MTQRVCFQLQIDPAKLDDYVARHGEVWPEMRRALSETGWRNYSLFVTRDAMLVGYLECDDFDAAQANMAATEVNARWQDEMAGYFVALGDQRPDQGLRPLREIFHLE